MTSSIEAFPAISTHKTGISMLPLPGEDMKKTLFVNTMVMQQVFTNNALNQKKREYNWFYNCILCLLYWKAV